jgi:5-methylcytosine-specific restriction endonuclease McrA
MEETANPTAELAETYRWKRIFERDNFTCQYCGWCGDQNFEHWFVAGLCIDHVKPRSAGGTDDESNVVVSCHSCNHYKGAARVETLEQARTHVAQRRDIARQWFMKYVVGNPRGVV